MKAYWYNGGLHIEAESDGDHDILMGVMNFLKIIEIDVEVEISPIVIKADHE